MEYYIKFIIQIYHILYMNSKNIFMQTLLIHMFKRYKNSMMGTI